jgi:hypothetical protein
VWYLPVESTGDIALERREFFALLIDVAVAQPRVARAAAIDAGDRVSWEPLVRKPCLGISTVQWL